MWIKRRSESRESSRELQGRLCGVTGWFGSLNTSRFERGPAGLQGNASLEAECHFEECLETLLLEWKGFRTPRGLHWVMWQRAGRLESRPAASLNTSTSILRAILPDGSSVQKPLDCTPQQCVAPPGLAPLGNYHFEPGKCEVNIPDSLDKPAVGSLG